MIRAFLITALLGAPMVASAQTGEDGEPIIADAPQDWQVCNETSYVLRLAIASPVNGKMTPRGWTRIRPGDCEAPDGAIGIQRFIYAESSGAHQGGIREWKGGTPLCATDTDFTADATMSCALQDMTERLYIPVSPDDPKTVFVETDDYGDKAVTAGIQRLLRDNGYEISRIDGISGRRTSKTMAQFVKDQELSDDLNEGAKIDALEQAAFAHVKTVGLTVCNDSSRKVWAAIGQRRKGNWESKGWWSVDPNACLQPVTSSLLDADMHFYAVQEGLQADDESRDQTPDHKLISSAAQPAQFCVADSRFWAMGRENCADKGYGAADFRVLPADKDGMTIKLSDADFSAPSSTGLRR